MTQVAIIDTGVSNLASVIASLRRLGAEPVVCRTPDQASGIERWCLPGVGSFQAGIEALRAADWEAAILGQLEQQRPLLAICLGLQMLTEGSAEAPEESGLGVLRGRCERLQGDAPLPQLGWNRVQPESATQAVRAGTAAFANSYALAEAPSGTQTSWSEHGAPFVAATEVGSLVACQFHPELSGSWGEALIVRALRLPEHQAPVGAEPSPVSAATTDTAAPLDTPDGSGSTQEAVARKVLSEPVVGTGKIIRMVPCLDVLDGRVVKGIQFQQLRDMGSPAEQAALYQDQGADEIVMLDIGASPAGAAHQLRSVEEVRQRLSIPLTVGGGVREFSDAQRLLEAGADKVAINSAALAQPYLIHELSERLGRQCIVLAVDAQLASERWVALSHGGRKVGHSDAIAWMREGQLLGAGEILLTSWDRDGTREGADLELLAAARAAVEIPIVSSGGIGTVEHVLAAVRSGADAVLAASIFHEATLQVGELKRFPSSHGVAVRS